MWWWWVSGCGSCGVEVIKEKNKKDGKIEVEGGSRKIIMDLEGGVQKKKSI